MRIGCQIGMWKGEESFEEKIAAVGTTGVSGVEVFVDHLQGFYDRAEDLRAILEGAGLALSGAYFNSGRFLDVEAQDDIVAEAAAACRFLREVGGEFLLLNGGLWKGDTDRAFTDEEFAHLANVFNRIGAEAERIGVSVVMHPHQKCQVETPADVDRLAAAGLDWARVGLCVHAAHQHLIDADPYEIYEKHAARVRYVHVGDSDAEKKAALLGEGALDQERLMRPLLEAGFDGWIIIECGKEGVTPEGYAADAIAYMKRTWPRITWES
jgi:sugar phosphate isomerase/epimerase